MKTISRSKWPTITIPLGDSSVAASRRQAYLDAAGEAGSNSLSEWMRKILDAAAGFKPQDSAHEIAS